MDNQDGGTSIYNVLEIRDLSTIADIKAMNPGFSTHTHEYMEKCQRCVVAYEVRRRGYDVVAKPRILSCTDPLPYMTNPLGWPAVYKDRRLETALLIRENWQRKSRSLDEIIWG
ncbi:MAG: hypothetical protein K2O16_09485 [Lachnospiraceae bacterium]|nr:hypothetical protein [Lachnospiraceae bacterium]